MQPDGYVVVVESFVTIVELTKYNTARPKGEINASATHENGPCTKDDTLNQKEATVFFSLIWQLCRSDSRAWRDSHGKLIACM